MEMLMLIPFFDYQFISQIVDCPFTKNQIITLIYSSYINVMFTEFKSCFAEEQKVPQKYKRATL